MAKLSIDLVVDDKGNVTIDKTRQNFGKLDEQIRKADSSIGKFGGELKKIGAVVGGYFAVSGLVNLAKDSLQAMDNIAKLSQKVGIGAETLQVYGYAAKLSGIELDTVASSLGKLARNIVTTTEKGEDSANAFKTLGISTHDSEGKLKNLDDVMGDVADRFAGMEDGTTKTALAMSLFGRSGKEMIPMLNLGREGLEEMREEAHRLGIVLDTDTILKAEEFNDNLERLQIGLQGMAARAIGELLPALNDISEAFVQSAKDGESFQSLAESLTGTLKVMASVAIGVVAAFDIVGTAIGEGIAAIVHGISQIPAGIMGGQVEVWQGGSSLESKLTGYGDLIEGFWNRTSGTSRTPKKKGAAPGIANSKAAKEIENINKRISDQIAQLTLTPAEQITRQADEWKSQGADAIRINEWVAAKMQAINVETYKFNAKLEEEQLKRREKMADEYEKIFTEEADFARTENERQINAITAQENTKLGKLYELYLEGAISFEELEKTKTMVEENAAAARLKKETDNAKRIADINYELVQDIIGIEETAFAMKMDQIEAQKNKFIADGADVVLAAKWASNQQIKAMIQLGKKGESVAAGIGAAFQQAYLDQMTWGQMGYDITIGFHDEMVGSFSNMLYDMKDGMNSFADYWDAFTDAMWRRFADAVAKMVADWLYAMATMAESSSGLFGGGGFSLTSFIPGYGMFSSLSSLFSGGAAVGGAAMGAEMFSAEAMASMIWLHGGGIVGETVAPTRSVSPAVFLNAPRLHSGLASDEFPAILQRGEEVVRRGGSGGTTNHFYITVKGSVVTEQDLARKLVPKINKAIREGAH